MHRFVFLFLSCLCTVQWAWAEDTPGTNSTVSTELPTGIVMRVNGQDIPSEWFLHEFQSTFFRYPETQNVRRVVFDSFYKRMLLAAKARELGLDKKPDVVDEINRRISGMKSFMDFKLQMTELDIINTALVKEIGLKTSPESISDEQLEVYYDQFIKPRPGAPATLAGVPKYMIESLRSQAAQLKLELDLDKSISKWITNMTVEINQAFIDSVPIPEMKGDVPQGAEKH